MSEGQRIYFITKIGFRCPVCHKEHFFDTINWEDPQELDAIEAMAPFWSQTSGVQYTGCGTFELEVDYRQIKIIMKKKKEG